LHSVSLCLQLQIVRQRIIHISHRALRIPRGIIIITMHIITDTHTTITDTIIMAGPSITAGHIIPVRFKD
jgi:hypothetical protein